MLRLAQGVQLVRVPCAVGDRVEMREAVFHSGLTRPVAFINGVDLVPLTMELTSAASSARPIAGQRVSEELRKSTVSWLVRHGVLEPVTAHARSAKS
jgi:hypothetical protein